MSKPVFDKKIFTEIWPKLCDAPITQISKDIQEDIQDFEFEKATSLDVYLFCSEISASPDISSFVRVLFDVANYYERPTE